MTSAGLGIRIMGDDDDDDGNMGSDFRFSVIRYSCDSCDDSFVVFVVACIYKQEGGRWMGQYIRTCTRFIGFGEVETMKKEGRGRG